ncbi:hypothetical protein BVU76_22430 [Mycolicibacterium porcinum]|nr:hypothetical protein BVU76_22430 [Mycolicibacterium porcinum]
MSHPTPQWVWQLKSSYPLTCSNRTEDEPHHHSHRRNTPMTHDHSDERISAYINRALAQAPPLTQAQRDKLSALLAPARRRLAEERAKQARTDSSGGDA